MTTYYVNSAVVGGTGSGNSWANASPTMAKAINNSAAGDDFNVVYTHSESNAASYTMTFKGTTASPNRIFSCTNANAPATASDLRAGATITITGASYLNINGSLYMFGMNFNIGTGTTGVSSGLQTTGGGEAYYDSCNFNHLGTVGIWTLMLGTNPSKITFSNTVVSFNGGTGCHITQVNNMFKWINTANASMGSQRGMTFFFPPTAGSFVNCDGVDFSNLTGLLVNGTLVPWFVEIVNCKTTGSVVTPSGPQPETNILLSNTSNTGYIQNRTLYQGALTASPVTILTGGATDGITPISWKIVTTANSKKQSPFESFETMTWFNGTLNTSYTATLQLTGQSGLTNVDVWMEVYYLGDASTPISSIISTGPITQLSNGVALTSSASSWTSGLASNYSMTATFTPQIPGLVRAIVKVAAPSITLYVDPKLTIV
jgi:hypothetical protein